MHRRWPPAELELFCDPALPSKTEVKCVGVTLAKETTLKITQTVCAEEGAQTIP